MVRISTRAKGVEGLELEVLRSRRGGAGSKALVPWSELYPSGGPLYRYVDPTGVGAGRAEEGPAHAPYQRFKAHHQRDGRGLYATRLGRDTSFPPLAPLLGG